jgi:peptidoglycan/xylan/chitin deacetylase (PgdA/CDA1 family)
MRIFELNFYKKIIKLLISWLIYYSGLILITRRFMPYNKGIYFLAYHRVTDDDFDCLDLNVKVDTFEKQIKFISQNYKTISLEKAVELLKKGDSIPDKTIVVTFDDGYRDNYINAFPILKKYRIPATIFLSVESIDKGQTFWFDKITYAVKRTKKKQIDLRKFNLREYLLQSEYDKKRAVNEIVLFAKKLIKEQLNSLTEYILKVLEVNLEEINVNYSILKWDDIVEMRNNRITFGSHGMNHIILANLSQEEAKFEVIESRKKIQEKSEIEVKFYAYPNGDVDDFNEDIVNLLKENGFSAACTLVRGSNNNGSLYKLHRYSMTNEVLNGLLGRFSKSLFEMELLGAFEIFRKKTMLS